VWVYVIPNAPVMEIQMVDLVKPASSVKGTRDLHHTDEGTTCKILGVGKNQEDLEHVHFENGTGTATIHGGLAILSSAPHFRQLVFGEHWYGDSLICI
jgi:hypothetical protein